MIERKTTEIKYLCKGIKNNFIKIGSVLKEIRDKKLYIENYDSFNQYLISSDFLFSRSHAYNFIKAFEVFGVQPLDTIPLNNIFRLAYVSDKEQRDELVRKQPESSINPPNLTEFKEKVKRTDERTKPEINKGDDLRDKTERILGQLLTDIEEFNEAKNYMESRITKALEMALKYSGEQTIVNLRQEIMKKW